MGLPGATAPVFHVLLRHDFIAGLVALVPRPRVNLARLGLRYPWRARLHAPRFTSCEFVTGFLRRTEGKRQSASHRLRAQRGTVGRKGLCLYLFLLAQRGRQAFELALHLQVLERAQWWYLQTKQAVEQKLAVLHQRDQLA
jgi:hypothetical protein